MERFDAGDAGFMGDSLYDSTSIVCLQVEDASQIQADETGYFEIAGRVVSDLATSESLEGNMVACAEDPMRILEVREPSGLHWFLGYSWTSDDGWDRTPAIGVQSGDFVQLIVRADPASEAAGFVVESDGELLYAMEAGRDGQGLLASDLPTIEVTEGSHTGSSSSTCGGERDYVTLDFTSDSDAERLGPSGDGTLMVDGDYYTVCNINSYSISEPDSDCELSSETSWMLFR